MFSLKSISALNRYILISLLIIYIASRCISAAPTTSSDNQNGTGNRLLKSGLLSNLFRRQTRQQGDDTPTTSTEGSTETDNEEPQSQTELEAQRFVDSLPGAQDSGKEGPSTFRERVSDTFGLLREGVSNQFKSLRENFSDTVEDLKDTWSGSE